MFAKTDGFCLEASTTVENIGDDKSDDKYFCHARKRLKTLTFLRFYRKTLTPYVRVRILLPLPIEKTTPYGVVFSIGRVEHTLTLLSAGFKKSCTTGREGV